MASELSEGTATGAGDQVSCKTPFTLKKWNAVAMWSWDVECDTCAICRVQVMGKLLLLVLINIIIRLVRLLCRYIYKVN